jgi:hypothetical protein
MISRPKLQKEKMNSLENASVAHFRQDPVHSPPKNHAGSESANHHCFLFPQYSFTNYTRKTKIIN